MGRAELRPCEQRWKQSWGGTGPGPPGSAPCGLCNLRHISSPPVELFRSCFDTEQPHPSTVHSFTAHTPQPRQVLSLGQHPGETTPALSSSNAMILSLKNMLQSLKHCPAKRESPLQSSVYDIWVLYLPGGQVPVWTTAEPTPSQKNSDHGQMISPKV